MGSSPDSFQLDELLETALKISPWRSGLDGEMGESKSNQVCCSAQCRGKQVTYNSPFPMCEVGAMRFPLGIKTHALHQTWKVCFSSLITLATSILHHPRTKSVIRYISVLLLSKPVPFTHLFPGKGIRSFAKSQAGLCVISPVSLEDQQAPLKWVKKQKGKTV